MKKLLTIIVILMMFSCTEEDDNWKCEIQVNYSDFNQYKKEGFRGRIDSSECDNNTEWWKYNYLLAKCAKFYIIIEEPHQHNKEVFKTYFPDEPGFEDYTVQCTKLN